MEAFEGKEGVVVVGEDGEPMEACGSEGGEGEEAHRADDKESPCGGKDTNDSGKDKVAVEVIEPLESAFVGGQSPDIVEDLFADQEAPRLTPERKAFLDFADLALLCGEIGSEPSDEFGQENEQTDACKDNADAQEVSDCGESVGPGGKEGEEQKQRKAKGEDQAGAKVALEGVEQGDGAKQQEIEGGDAQGSAKAFGALLGETGFGGGGVSVGSVASSCADQTKGEDIGSKRISKEDDGCKDGGIGEFDRADDGDFEKKAVMDKGWGDQAKQRNQGKQRKGCKKGV